jgi:pimeloyl-ACP methyl ester carboxylesterase
VALGEFDDKPCGKERYQRTPSYYLVTSDDKMIPPPAQRKMAERAKAQVTEVAASHSVHVSKPSPVAEIIEKAAASSN